MSVDVQQKCIARVPVEKKKAEAIKRMKALGIFPQTIRQFEKEGLVSISEPPMGAFYWAEGEDLERIREFEEARNAVVYVVVRSYMTFGKMDAYLYVSDYEEEWPDDMAGAQEGEVLAYVYNHDAPDRSELGYIGVERTPAAGLRRVW